MAVGRDRRPRRIQEVLDRFKPKKTMADVARAAGVIYQTAWATTQGLKNNRNVLKYYISIGVPLKYLDLPEDLRTGAKKADGEG